MLHPFIWGFVFEEGRNTTFMPLHIATFRWRTKKQQQQKRHLSHTVMSCHFSLQELDWRNTQKAVAVCICKTMPCGIKTSRSATAHKCKLQCSQPNQSSSLYKGLGTFKWNREKSNPHCMQITEDEATYSWQNSHCFLELMKQGVSCWEMWVLSARWADCAGLTACVIKSSFMISNCGLICSSLVFDRWYFWAILYFV